MPHIHEKIDFIVNAYIVHDSKVLLVHHKEFNKWLPVGGHVELDEDPEEAIYREVKEESGLEIKIIGSKPKINSPETKFLYPPTFMNIHNISDTHKHIGLIYIATTDSSNVKLQEEESNAIKWFSESELDDSQYGLLPSIKYYAKEALRMANEWY